MFKLGFKSTRTINWIGETENGYFVGDQNTTPATFESREQAEAFATRPDGLGLADCLMAKDEIYVIMEA